MTRRAPDRPTSPSCSTKSSAALAIAPGETHVDGTFGAGGYTKAMLDKGAARIFAFDRDPQAIQGGESGCGRQRGAPDACSGAFFPDASGASPTAASTRSTASRSTSACPPCSSTRPSAASPSRPTGRSTCGWAAEGRSAADIVNEAGRERARRHPLPLWRGEAVAPGRPRDRRRPPDHPHRRAGRGGPQGARPSSGHEEGPGDPHLPGAADRGERGTGRARGRAGGGRAGARAAAAGSPSSPSTASRTGS